MDHPLLHNLASKTEEEIVEKINQLTQKWFQTGNPEAKLQIQTMLDTYKLEMIDRSAKQSTGNGDKDLDKLINVS